MKEHIEQLIDKFWAGTASLEERLDLLERLDQDNTALREKLEASFQQEEVPKVLQLIDVSAQERLLERIHKSAGIAGEERQLTVRRRSVLWMAVAASLIIAIGTVTWFNMQEHNDLSNVQQANLSEVKAVDIINDGNTVKNILLPDSSKVVLYPLGNLHYDADFGKATRQIKLSGTARFSVAHDKKRPFTVFANGFATTALGTEFTVNGSAKGKTTVELFSGKVVVQDRGNSRMADVYMTPGDQLSISNLSGKFSIVNKLVAKQSPVKDKREKSVQLAETSAFKFKASPLTEVFAKIESLKNVKIISDGASIENKVFTGEILAEDSLEDMLSLICGMNGLAYEIKEGLVTIKQK